MFDALGKIDTNGRDIKNYTRTAYAFARAEEEDLTLDQVLIVLRNNMSEDMLERHKVHFENLDGLKVKLRKVIEEWDRRHALEMATADEVKDDEQELDKRNSPEMNMDINDKVGDGEGANDEPVNYQEVNYQELDDEEIYLQEMDEEIDMEIDMEIEGDEEEVGHDD
jgi:hypothetical protein